MSISPASSTSVTPIGRERTDSAEARLRELFDSPKESSSRQGRSLIGRREGGKEDSIGNSRKYARMGLVMESPIKDGPQLPWAMGSPKFHGPRGTLKTKGNGPSVVGEGGGAIGTMPRSSPPIAVNVENFENGVRSPRREGHPNEMDGVVSSPDSGYGNTPDQPSTSMHLGGRAAAMIPPAVVLPRRSRSGAIMGPNSQRTMDSSGDDPFQASHSEGLRGTEVATRDSSYSSGGGSGGASDLGQYGGRRQREDTQDSAFSMDSSVGHHQEGSSSPSRLQQLMDDSINEPLPPTRRAMRQANTCGGRLNTYSAPPSSSQGSSRSAHAASRPSSALTQTGSLASSMSVSQGTRKKHRFLYQRSLSKSTSGEGDAGGPREGLGRSRVGVGRTRKGYEIKGRGEGLKYCGVRESSCEVDG